MSARAEVLKIARLLDVTPERLSYLEALEVDELRALRGRVIDAMFDADREKFQRVATAAKIPPVAVTAGIAQKKFGPLLVSRVAAVTDTDRAVDIGSRLSPRFLADVAIEIDPRRASAVIAGIPAELTGDIAGELCRRGEYVAMGQFVGHLTEEGIVESLRQIDDASLLRISFVLEEKDRLDEVITLLGPKRQKGTIRAAVSDDLVPEALDLLASVSDETARVLWPLVVEALDEVKDADDRAAVEAALAEAREKGLV